MKRHGTAGVLSRPAVPPSAPADACEEAGNLARRAVGIFPVREVTDAGKHRKIEIGKSLAELVCPGVWKQRIWLGPAHAGRYIDRRKLWRFALHHLPPPRMRRAIMCKATGEIA